MSVPLAPPLSSIFSPCFLKSTGTTVVFLNLVCIGLLCLYGFRVKEGKRSHDVKFLVPEVSVSLTRCRTETINDQSATILVVR